MTTAAPAPPHPFTLALQTARAAASLTQSAAASRLNVSRSALTKWEQGDLTPNLPTQIGCLWLLGASDETIQRHLEAYLRRG